MPRPKKIDPGAPAWVVTYGDMMSLLLTFFILLVSFAELDVQKYKQLAGQMKEAFGVQRNEPVEDLPKGMDLIARDFNPDFTAEELTKRIKSAIKIPDKGRVEILNDMRGSVFRISDDNFFDKGSAMLRPNAWPVLDTLIAVAQSVDNPINFEVFNETGEILGTAFKDDWELSAARAIDIARYFQKFGNLDPKRLNPVIRGNTVKAEGVLGRRVEIVFEKKVDTGGQELNRLFSPTEKAAPGKAAPNVDIFKLGR